MTRCDYDAMFYRVFCITLLAIAFTFTVILTSVFVDIDGLLVSKKENLNRNIIRRNEFTTEATDNDDINYVDSESSYRTKRSIETQSFLFHIKNPKVKNILANRLSTLLEELEAEESADAKTTEKNIVRAKTEETTKAAETTKLGEDENKDKTLHLSMHNVLLQGIDRHMNLNDVYKKMFASMSNFNNLHERKDGSKRKSYDMKKNGEESKLSRSFQKFFDEILNNNELQKQMIKTTTVKPVKAIPKVVIKTVIDITSVDHNKLKENDTKTLNENIQGDVEVVYNGKVIKFTHSDAEMVQTPPEKKLPVTLKPMRTVETTTTDYFNMIPKSYMNKFVEEYFKHFPHDTKESTSKEIKQHIQTKRLKRHVRIKYKNENPGEAKKTLKKNTEEDELYVEIETHFDSKGMKGEKKKKLIKSLVEKIQKAIHSEPGKPVTTGKNNTKKIRKSVHFRKRMQNPLKHKFNHVFVDKYNLPTSNIVHRELHPISKTVPLEDRSAPAIGTKSGEEWKKPNLGPGFLASTKAINSAEMSELNVDYSKILEVNGIPQRLQQPLNTELSEETIKTNSYYDMGRMKFIIKDIDGSGFSVGFNQYVDEPPDTESMRLFSGLENILKSYHQTYDPIAEVIPTTEAMLETEERRMEPTSDEHIIERRSIDEKHDYHSNEYKIIFNNDFLPYKDYSDIYKSKVEKHKHTQKKSKKKGKVPLVLDENIFEKNLKPSEILSLANMFDRKKRAVNKDTVKVISNLKTRRKVNRFLNTNTRSKTIFLNTKSKRNKRQINKIRIIATDLPEMSQNSDENVFVVSNENVMADRALLKEVETSDGVEKQEETQYFDPYPNDDSNTYVTKIFDGRSRRNPLMSKYPHIFMEEISRSREDYLPNNALLFGKLPGLGKRNTEMEINDDDKIDIEPFMTPATNIPNNTETQKQFSEQEMLSALIASPVNKPNYKVTVKIIPKNQTGVNSGFKEIHTSINKSFNRNGLLYSSLVNVSEISKVVKLNRSDDEIKDNQYSRREESLMTQKIQDQQEKMQFLLKQHAKHINEQLHRLHEEKMSLESMLKGDNNTDIYNYALNLTSRRLKLAAAKVEVTTTTTEAVKEVQTTTVPPSVELIPSITTPSHTTKLLNFEEKIRNNNIISTIERNGNLTDQILKKIDRNTEILQMFLQKLTERIEAPLTLASPKPEIVKDDRNTYRPDWTNEGAEYTQNMVIRKNDSHISIPFTYAYQPPTSLPVKKSKTQVASVVYQGHIRNAVRHRDIPHSEQENQLQKVQEVNNQSKFFIDDLENGYKIIRMGGFKKNRDFNLVRNSTST